MIPSFRRALKKVIAQVLEVQEVSVEELLITQNRRLLLSGVSVTPWIFWREEKKKSNGAIKNKIVREFRLCLIM